jgi:hypothetical protein
MYKLKKRRGIILELHILLFIFFISLGLSCSTFHKAFIQCSGYGCPVQLEGIDSSIAITSTDWKNIPPKIYRSLDYKKNSFADDSATYFSGRNFSFQEYLIEEGSSKNNREGFILFVDRLFRNDTAVYFCSCILYAVKCDSLYTETYRLPEIVHDWSGAKKYLIPENQMLFGGGILQKRQVRKWHRKAQKKRA